MRPVLFDSCEYTGLKPEVAFTINHAQLVALRKFEAFEHIHHLVPRLEGGRDGMEDSYEGARRVVSSDRGSFGRSAIA